VLLAGCANPTPTSRASAAARSACRTHADEVFEQQNRGAMYLSDTYSTGVRDSPFASSGLPGPSTSGLSQQFGIDTTMQNCLNGTGNGTGDTPAATAASPPGIPPVASSAPVGAAARPTVK
jgi:hypothetical protein